MHNAQCTQKAGNGKQESKHQPELTIIEDSRIYIYKLITVCITLARKYTENVGYRVVDIG